MLVALFLLAGVLGHGPWKQDEPYIFGVVYHYLKTRTWLVPVNAGLPFMEKPPLYYWTAVLCARIFGLFLPLYDAARLASVAYMGVVVAFMWKTGAALFAGAARSRQMAGACVFLLLGSVGVVRFAHEMVTDIPLLASTTVALYGMALLLCGKESAGVAGLWTGLGVGMAFMSKGLFMPGVLSVSGLVLLAALPELRTARTARAVGLAVLVALPFVLLWPLALYRYSPFLFNEWLWQNNIGRFQGFSVARLGADNTDFYFLWVTPFLAFPAAPLAALALWRTRAQWREPRFALPMAVGLVGLLTLLVSASGRAQYLLPLLPVTAILGAMGLARLRETVLVRWNGLVRILFSLSLLGIWALWAGLAFPHRNLFLDRYAGLFGQWLPLDFVPGGGHWVGYGFALAACLFWCLSLRWKGNSTTQTPRIWLAGCMAVWASVFTLLLPWIDVTRSYDTVFAEMVEAAGRDSASGCIATFNLGESVGPLYEYYTATTLRGLKSSEGKCPYLFLKTMRDVPYNNDPRWRMIWKGSRPLDSKNEQLRLYRRVAHDPA